VNKVVFFSRLDVMELRAVMVNILIQDMDEHEVATLGMDHPQVLVQYGRPQIFP